MQTRRCALDTPPRPFLSPRLSKKCNYQEAVQARIESLVSEVGLVQEEEAVERVELEALREKLAQLSSS